MLNKYIFSVYLNLHGVPKSESWWLGRIFWWVILVPQKPFLKLWTWASKRNIWFTALLMFDYVDRFCCVYTQIVEKTMTKLKEVICTQK